MTNAVPAGTGTARSAVASPSAGTVIPAPRRADGGADGGAGSGAGSGAGHPASEV